MSVNTKMKAIADKIRLIRGLASDLTLDDMADELNTVNTEIDNAFTAVGNKGGAVPQYKLSHNLASAIDTIPTGVEVKKETGNITTGLTNGIATVSNLGFMPDIVAFNEGVLNEGVYFLGAMFAESGNSTHFVMLSPPSSAYIMSLAQIKRITNGFTIEVRKITSSGTISADTNRALSYTAIKYT